MRNIAKIAAYYAKNAVHNKNFGKCIDKQVFLL